MATSAAIRLREHELFENADTTNRALFPLIPAVTNRPCEKRSFDCLVSALAYLVFQTLWFGFVGNDSAG